jgi:hypothetical protein
MRISCPLLVDEHEVCGQMIEVTIYPGEDRTWDYPGSGPVVEKMEGQCPHVREFDYGNGLTDDQQEALIDAVADRIADTQEAEA